MKWLKYYREKSGLSMNKLAELIDVQLNTVWRWENGRASPSVDIARKIANVFNITESELLNGPATQNWELKLVINRNGNTNEGVIDLTAATSNATLEMSDFAMGITLSAAYDLWEDDDKFENLIEQLRRKRQLALKARREDWE